MDGKELHYHPDIDGLRAVAVLSVIGFHVRSWLRLVDGYAITAASRMMIEGKTRRDAA